MNHQNISLEGLEFDEIDTLGVEEKVDKERVTAGVEKEATKIQSGQR